MKRRTLLIMAIICFIIAILSITGIIFEVRSCYAGDIKDVIGLHRSQRHSYLYMKQAGSAHVYWATYDISFNYGSIKVKGTHSTDYIVNRPPKKDNEGNLTPEFLKWLATLNYTHMTNKGEKLTLWSNAGTDSTVRTHKSGKYYFHVWASDARHAQYVQWCLKNGVKLGN